VDACRDNVPGRTFLLDAVFFDAVEHLAITMMSLLAQKNQYCDSYMTFLPFIKPIRSPFSPFKGIVFHLACAALLLFVVS
jgi:hypothetical protein